MPGPATRACALLSVLVSGRSFGFGVGFGVGLEAGSLGGAISSGTDNHTLAGGGHEGSIFGPEVDEAVGETVADGVNTNMKLPPQARYLAHPPLVPE